jgi:hypothetical protein
LIDRVGQFCACAAAAHTAMAAPTSMLTKSFTSSSRKALVDYAGAVRGSSSDHSRNASIDPRQIFTI